MFLAKQFSFALTDISRSDYGAVFSFRDMKDEEYHPVNPHSNGYTFGQKIVAVFNDKFLTVPPLVQCNIFIAKGVFEELEPDSILMDIAAKNHWVLKSWNVNYSNSVDIPMAIDTTQISTKNNFMASFSHAGPLGILAAITEAFKSKYRENKSDFGIAELCKFDSIRNYMSV